MRAVGTSPTRRLLLSTSSHDQGIEAEAEEEISEKPRAKKAKTEESNEGTATEPHPMETAYQTGGFSAVVVCMCVPY